MKEREQEGSPRLHSLSISPAEIPRHHAELPQTGDLSCREGKTSLLPEERARERWSRRAKNISSFDLDGGDGGGNALPLLLLPPPSPRPLPKTSSSSPGAREGPSGTAWALPPSSPGGRSSLPSSPRSSSRALPTLLPLCRRSRRRRRGGPPPSTSTRRCGRTSTAAPPAGSTGGRGSPSRPATRGAPRRSCRASPRRSRAPTRRTAATRGPGALARCSARSPTGPRCRWSAPAGGRPASATRRAGTG